MKVYREVYLAPKSLTAQQLIEALKQFTEQTAHWSFRESESAIYAAPLESPSCIIATHREEMGFAFAIAKMGVGKRYYVANIVPECSGSITLDKYNLLALNFSRELGAFFKEEAIPVSISVTKDEIGLETIISSKKARDAFEHYLNCHPTSEHPLDIHRLDLFIHRSFIFCRKKIDTNLLKRYLVEELQWDKTNADRCIERIEIGWSVLRVGQSA